MTHAPAADLAALLACPRCGTALTALRCPACRVEFPVHGGIPWLFADPAAAVSDWQNRWQLAVERLDADRERVQQALAPDPPAATRRRLEALVHGYRQQQRHLDDLLTPLTLARRGSLETLLALRTRLPVSQGIFSYDANVFRDWCWGEAECAEALTAVLNALGDTSPTRILVLGAGAGRLAYDLHQHTQAAITVAADLNPLLGYVGRRVSGGERVALVEFPMAPRAPEDAAIERTLQAPAPARAGLEFVLADVLRAPFVSGAFDLVVSPWLLDVVDAQPDEMLQRINGLLTTGGIWVNQGSVAFQNPDPTWRLTLDELLALAESAGLTDARWTEQSVPYMDCPESRHGRRECVVTLRMTKARCVAAPPRHDSLPDWVVQGRKPVPLLPAFQNQAMTTRMHAFIMSLIDGKRSLKDMARVLEEQRLMPAKDAETALRGFLAKMYEEAKG